MPNLRDVHLKIKALSKNNQDGRPHIYVTDLAKELNIPTDDVKPFLAVLHSTAFIDYYKDCKDIIALTETGKTSEIPLHGSWEKPKTET